VTVKRPLVVTLRLDDAATQRFDAERTALFPAGRTEVGAHVTLFHAVPDGEQERVLADLTELTGRQPFPVAVTEVWSLGHGAAYTLASSELEALHRELQRRWWKTLTKQDRQGLRAHVTVQNKVSPAVAARTLADLRTDFAPHDVRAVGLRLWRYDDGPWTLLADVPFALRHQP